VAKKDKVFVPFVVKGIIYIAVPYIKNKGSRHYTTKEDCIHCALFVNTLLCKHFGHLGMNCSHVRRDDKTEVLFRKIRRTNG